MIAARASRLVAQVFVAVVLVGSGTYLLVYLYRWEWNRAVISGLFFVAAEVALGISLVLARLRRIEARLDAGSAPAAAPPRAPVLADNAVSAGTAEAGDAAGPAGAAGAERPFSWLDPTGGGFGVFVPVLMGAGAILSVVAMAVERLAGSVAHQSAGSGPLPGGAGSGAGATTAVPRRHHALMVGVAVVMGLVLVLAGIDVLADATQNRPDPLRAGSTAVLVEVRLRDGGSSVEQASEALWFACRSVLDPIPAAVVRPAGQGQASLTLDGQLGRNARRRLVGCLEDATLDRVQADVRQVETYGPAEAPPRGTV